MVSPTISVSSSEEPTAGTTSDTAPTVTFRSYNGNLDRTFDLPTSCESAAALEHVGLVADTAQEIFNRYQTRIDPDNNPNTLLDLALGHVARISVLDKEPRAAMTQVGIKASIQEAILKPEHEQVYQTETLLYWVHDTIRTNFTTLEMLIERLKARAEQSLSKKGKKAKVEGLNAEEPAELSGGLPSPIVASLGGVPSDEEHSGHLPKTFTVVEEAIPVLENHYELFKGKAPSDMPSPIWEPLITEAGDFHMQAISTHSGGDFNMDPAWYFTPERETAEIYRKYAEDRCMWSETWMIRILVPKPFIESLKKEELYYSPDWKEFVWTCPKGRITAPKKFAKYTEAQLLKGHICKNVSSVVMRATAENLQQKLTEDNLMQISTGKSTQWAFLRRQTAVLLASEIKGKVHIDVYASKMPQEAESIVLMSPK
ncbi:hypothetical protein CC80DRAFT_437357 [Byssothecium circinans]|uniref:Uncharacterized protein n=1 Tax=Byssothecium circinans TaxID=147558 RepID=A0A6A5U9B5_9PLEO|nr:hypothetical protein CC80DRAFT_437357 [Byssothecium circinans]